MDNISKKVKEEIDAGWIGSNTHCPYHPSHFVGQDCTFCYCLFYPCRDQDLGSDIVTKRGTTVWNCTDCLLIHRKEVGRFLMSEIKEKGITDPKDPRIAELFPEMKRKFYREGKALMVLGATSDAGKSVTVAALCRIFHRKGYLVAPFKSQNMSLNSKVTMNGCEIAMIQALQAQAAGLKNPDHHMNPILLKPKGDARSQVMVEGKPFGDYDVRSYYEEFVPGPGAETVRSNVEFLKKRYDLLVMEGAGSPAEINIYDRDLANMKAAEIADADCILVVNVEWGGSFAYVLGTVMLMPEKDRSRIKGIIFNKVRGDPEKMRPGIEEIEALTGIPVLGTVPHADVFLPTEDSESFRDTDVKGQGSLRISVIKFPRIANFTDLDPLYMEDVMLRFVTDPSDLEGSDAIILPGTKNTVDDLKWMFETGMAEAVGKYRGKIPILGICGGYQMMGRELRDPSGLEGSEKGSFPGLGLFDNVTEWNEYKKKVIRDSGVLIETGEPVTGYEIHMGMSEVNEKPLFMIDRLNSSEEEGSVREDEMLFGTYLHGVFEKPAFRRRFISCIKRGEDVRERPCGDYEDLLEESIDRLADVFESNLDMDRIIEIAGVERRE